MNETLSLPTRVKSMVPPTVVITGFREWKSPDATSRPYIPFNIWLKEKISTSSSPSLRMLSIRSGIDHGTINRLSEKSHAGVVQGMVIGLRLTEIEFYEMTLQSVPPEFRSHHLHVLSNSQTAEGSFGMQIRSYRELSGYTPRGLAKRIGVDHSGLYRTEVHGRGMRFSTFARLVDRLRLNPSQAYKLILAASSDRKVSTNRRMI